MKRVLVTGAAGFVGYHAAERFLARGDEVIGLDNLNDYYDVRLKQCRLARLEAKRRFSFIKLDLKDPPEGFSAIPGTVPGTQDIGRLAMRTTRTDTKRPVALWIQGTAKIGDREIAHVATPVEDRMQAFLWRHLVPAQDLQAVVYDPGTAPPPRRGPRAKPPKK